MMRKIIMIALLSTLVLSTWTPALLHQSLFPTVFASEDGDKAEGEPTGEDTGTTSVEDLLKEKEGINIDRLETRRDAAERALEEARAEAGVTSLLPSVRASLKELEGVLEREEEAITAAELELQKINESIKQADKTIENLQAIRGVLNETEKNAREERTKAQEAVKTARDALAQDPDNESLKTALEEKQGALTKANEKLGNAQKAVAANQSDIEDTPEFRKERIEQKYDDLIKSAKEQGIKLGEKDRKGLSDTEIEILDEKIKANKRYVEFLEAKKNFDVCAVENFEKNTEKITCENRETEYEADVANTGRGVRNVLRVLTKLEQKLAREATFDVSKIFTPTGEQRPKRSFLEVTNQIADWMITLVSSLAVTALVIGGFMMIISGGDENRLELGKTIFKYSLIGLAVTLLAFAIISFLQAVFFA